MPLKPDPPPEPPLTGQRPALIATLGAPLIRVRISSMDYHRLKE